MIDLCGLGLVLSCCAYTPTSSDRDDETIPSQDDEQSTAASIEPPSPAVPEQPAAPPCSVEGMLLRDTPIRTFEYRCPRTLLPPEGEVARCIANSIAAERPFVTELVMPKAMPPHEQPLLVGATFNGHYEVRIYQESQRSMSPATQERAREPQRTGC